MGTALSKKQITQICRCTENKRIVLNFDADTAGIRAANRAISEVEHLAMQGQLELRVLHLPNAKDPDEFLNDHLASEYKALVEKSPLWLDWQLDQVLQDLDISKADHFQKAVSGFVQLLGKLPQSALRTHYLQKSAERLSGGQARLALKLEEDLRTQVKGQRWHGRSRKYEKVEESSLRERSEADILRLYLHSSINRSKIRQELFIRELDDFAIYNHRLLWALINDIEENILGSNRMKSINRGDEIASDLSSIDLPTLLLDECITRDDKLASCLTRLLEPGDVQIAAMSQPILQLRGALAVLEKQKALKRCRHLIEAWSSQRLETLEKCILLLIEKDIEGKDDSFDMESKIIEMFEDLNSSALNFQNLYYSERKNISHLDQQRCSTIRETI